MLVNLRYSIDQERIARIITNLQAANSDKVLQQINLRSFTGEALRELKRHFPRSNQSAHNINEFGMHLSDGWKEVLGISSGSVVLGLEHTLQNDPRAEAVLRSLDEGSRPFSFTAPANLVFPDFRPHASKRGKGRWVTIEEGQIVIRSARSGYNYTDRTYDFIVRTMIPRLRTEIQNKAAQILNS